MIRILFTILSMSGAAVAKALIPTVGTARPSASVDLIGTSTGFPAFNASEKLEHLSDSTPCKMVCLFLLVIRLKVLI